MVCRTRFNASDTLIGSLLGHAKASLGNLTHRHVDLVAPSLGVKSTVATPLAKDKPTIDEAEEEPLIGDDIFLHQSVTMRVGYISQSRAYLQREVRELANGMNRPTMRP